jgi:hypothetical protein
VNLDHERADLIAEADAVGQNFEDCGFRGLIQFFVALLVEFADAVVDQRAKRLNQVVSETKGVAAVAVVEADAGEQAGGDDGAGNRGADDGVTVVEKAVEAGEVGVAAKDEVEGVS